MDVNTEYFFVKIRTTKKYFCFLLFQLVLSLFVVIVALTQPLQLKNSMTIAAEITVALCIALDILVRVGSETHFWKSRQNQLDVTILATLIVIILFVCFFSTEKPGQDALEADDIMLLIIILIRYSIQIGRMICQLRSIHQLVFLRKDLRDIDMNQLPASQLKGEAMHTSQFVKRGIVRMASNAFNQEIV